MSYVLPIKFPVRSNIKITLYIVQNADKVVLFYVYSESYSPEAINDNSDSPSQIMEDISLLHNSFLVAGTLA